MNEGWIKLHRKLMRNALWRDCNSNQKVIMITLLLMASHDDNTWMFKGEEYKVQPGQFVTSLQNIADNAGLTINVVRKSLTKLEKYGFCTNKSTNKNRLITIENWAKYQEQNIDRNIEPNKQGTSKEQARNNYQECKNDKNERNKEYIPSNTTDEQLGNLIDFYQNRCRSLPAISKVTKPRRSALIARAKEYGTETVEEVFAKAEASDYLTGKVNGFKATFDWLLKPSNFLKVLEGNYDNRPSVSNGGDRDKELEAWLNDED